MANRRDPGRDIRKRTAIRPAPAVRPAAPLDVTTTQMVAGGEALARAADGRVLFVAGALPGEQVSVRPTGSGGTGWSRAQLVRIGSPGPARIEPACPQVAAGCGGCDWAHCARPDQLDYKVGIVAEALRRIGRITDVEPVAGGRVLPTAYRTTARLAVDRDGAVGFRAAGSHRVVTTQHCAVLHPRLAALLPTLRAPGATELTVRIGVASGERLACADRDGVLAGLPPDVRTGPASAVTEAIGGVRLRISAGSFFQSSPEAAELLVDAVRRAGGDALAGGAGRVIDAYGGVGLFAATLVAPGRPVTLVESGPAACADARLNLADHAAAGAMVGGARVRLAMVEVAMVAVERWRPQPADLVIADPARSGLEAAAVDVLAGTRAPVLVLVSCDPVAHARDAALLAAARYRLVRSEVLDLFPDTHHVEVVSRFERR